MLIIDHKHKDYYDGVAGTTGIDKAIVYDRKLSEFNEKNMPVFFVERAYYSKKRESPVHDLYSHKLTKEVKSIFPEYSHFIVGFCGKLYIGWKLYCEDKPIYPRHTTYSNKITTTITYDFDYMKTIVEPKCWGGLQFEDTVNYIKNFDAIQLFRDFKSPVFVYDGDYNRPSINKNIWQHKYNSKFYVNPLLKDYEFYKVFDAVQAFQEISMFMGGVLGKREKETIEVADKYKIEQHGFDYKWSFRKESENKKLK